MQIQNLLSSFKEEDSFDSDREWLFRIMDEMQQALVARASRESLEGMLARLTSYAAGQFGREEALMRELSYQRYTRHKQLHDGLLSRLGSLRQLVRESRSVDGAEMMRQIRELLEEHFAGPDRHFSNCLRTAVGAPGGAASSWFG